MTHTVWINVWINGYFQYPANYIRDVSIEKRFAEYPKLNDLIEKKNKAITESYCPPTYLNADLRTFNLESLKCQFDSIIIDAPLEEYKNTATKWVRVEPPPEKIPGTINCGRIDAQLTHF